MTRSRDDRGARLAYIVSFSSFFVFPAIPFGNTGALTIPHSLAALLVAVWIWRLKASDWQPYAWMMAPVVISGFLVLLAGDALVPDVVPKSILALAMSFIVVIPARRLLRSGHGDEFILAAAYAILLHAAVGAYQYVAFSAGQFPFASLMATNPSQAMPPAAIETYVEYVRRPFGLFAEPSAMAACVGPWLVVISGALFTWPRDGSRRQRTILALALASGLALVVVSQSGLAVVIVAGAAAPALWAAFSSRRSGIARWAALFVSVGIVGAAALWLMANAASRFQYSQNESWQARLASLMLAVRSLETPGHLFAGVGPGQSVAHVTSTALRDHAPGTTAVWSVTLTYAMETGVLGLACMLILTRWSALSIWASRARVAGVACAGVWLAGVTFATSYAQQPALWTAAAALLSWRSIAGARVADGQDRVEVREEPLYC